jgi:hypothetical protein
MGKVTGDGCAGLCIGNGEVSNGDVFVGWNDGAYPIDGYGCGSVYIGNSNNHISINGSSHTITFCIDGCSLTMGYEAFFQKLRA